MSDRVLVPCDPDGPNPRKHAPSGERLARLLQVMNPGAGAFSSRAAALGRSQREAHAIRVQFMILGSLLPDAGLWFRPELAAQTTGMDDIIEWLEDLVDEGWLEVLADDPTSGRMYRLTDGALKSIAYIALAGIADESIDSGTRE